jgi:hypothetical protein
VRNCTLLGICLLLWVCIVQSLYFPFLSAPQAQEAWWQFGPLAGAGLILGFPVLWLWEFFLKDRPQPELSFWVLSGVYVLLIYFLVGAAWRKVRSHGDL